MPKVGSALPELRIGAWRATRDALHAYAQVAGAVRGAFCPREKHWFHVSLRTDVRGLTTTPIPARRGTFEIALELATARWCVSFSDGRRWQVPLRGQSAAELFAESAPVLAEVVRVAKVKRSEFARKAWHDFDPEAVRRYWQVLSWVDLELKRFKASQHAETSPVQLWPHRFDIAMLLCSGRKIPDTDHDDPDVSDEQLNFGFVPGDDAIHEAYFYATAYPDPMKRMKTRLPPGAYWHTRGWDGAVLPYAELRRARDPEGRLQQFFHAFADWSEFLRRDE
ncbi:MAG TPA: DUF5996 family protein [Steroidobacteraceae bacterium]